MRLRQPSPFTLQLAAVPVGMALLALLVLAWLSLTPLASTPLDLHGTWAAVAALVVLAGGLPTLVAMHEILHALGHPGCGFSRASVLGIWPSRLLFYAAYLGPMSRGRSPYRLPATAGADGVAAAGVLSV